MSGPQKRRRQATTDPESETTSSDSDSSSTVDTSTSEGEDEKDFILPDYPSDELTSSESSDSEPEEAPAENLSTGWSERVTPVDTQFHGDQVGPQNIPDHINHESTALSFLELFLDADFWGLLCRQTNLRAEQVKESKPASYYAKNFKPVAVPELKAFLGLRLQMEKCVIKPRYESYWQGAGHNFIAHTPGFREVMECDRFIALWGFLHLVDQTDEAVDKSDKIYKVRPMLDRMLPLFRRYYSPRQQLSLDEGMIPTKNRLAIKQYIRDKPVRWGIKSFLLCEAKTGYILDAEIYTGRVKDRHWPLLGSAGSVVRRLVENSQVTNKNHMLFMDRFYNSVVLFHLLKNELGVQIARLNKTRRHYRWPRRLFMKFLVWAAYNAYIIMDSYRPHSRAGHRFRTFHMFVDELCLQLVGDYRTAVHRREARAQQSDLLRLQGVGQHHPERSPAATGNNLCVVCCAKYNKYLKKHPATAYGNMPHKRRKTTFWCSTCHKYLCLRVGSTCWSDFHTKVQFWR